MPPEPFFEDEWEAESRSRVAKCLACGALVVDKRLHAAWHGHDLNDPQEQSAVNKDNEPKETT
jgi:hypothetical protein